MKVGFLDKKGIDIGYLVRKLIVIKVVEKVKKIVKPK
jgi:hypothetical protein